MLKSLNKIVIILYNKLTLRNSASEGLLIFPAKKVCEKKNSDDFSDNVGSNGNRKQS